MSSDNRDYLVFVEVKADGWRELYLRFNGGIIRLNNFCIRFRNGIILSQLSYLPSVISFIFGDLDYFTFDDIKFGCYSGLL